MGLKDLFVKENLRNIESKNIDINDVLRGLPTETLKTNIDNSDVVFDNSNIDVIPANNYYQENGLDVTPNIHDIAGFIDALSPTLDIVAKKASLLKILQAAKFDIGILTIDAEKRKELLLQIIEKDVDVNKDRVLVFKNTINQKLDEIKELEMQINIEQERKKLQENILKDEIERVMSLKGYLE